MRNIILGLCVCVLFSNCSSESVSSTEERASLSITDIKYLSHTNKDISCTHYQDRFIREVSISEWKDLILCTQSPVQGAPLAFECLDDCEGWVIVQAFVESVTKPAPEHPGGSEVLYVSIKPNQTLLWYACACPDGNC